MFVLMSNSTCNRNQVVSDVNVCFGQQLHQLKLHFTFEFE